MTTSSTGASIWPEQSFNYGDFSRRSDDVVWLGSEYVQPIRAVVAEHCPISWLSGPVVQSQSDSVRLIALNTFGLDGVGDGQLLLRVSDEPLDASGPLIRLCVVPYPRNRSSVTNMNSVAYVLGSAADKFALIAAELQAIPGLVRLERNRRQM